MTGVAEQLDELRIAIGEVDVLATLTTAAYDAADWCESDPDVVEGVACLLGLIKKSAGAAKAAFLRLQGTVAGAQPVPATVEWDYEQGTAQGPTGRRAALFLTKSYVRLVRPTLDRLEPHLPDDVSDRLRRSWKDCEAAFESVAEEARIAA